MTTSPIHNIY